MGYEDAGAKQTQNDGDNFNHFTHPATLHSRLIACACFRIASSVWRNGFVPIGAGPDLVSPGGLKVRDRGPPVTAAGFSWPN